MSFFKVVERPHYLSVEFSAPTAGNAFSLAVARELSHLRQAHARWSQPVVVQSAHPTLFCSGGNLSDYKKLKSKASGLKINREIARHLHAFGAWPVVKLALVEGDVLGGGMEWLAQFDCRWSMPYAFFSFWQRRIGLSPGWGGGKVWATKIGAEKLRGLLLGARLFSATQAVQLGLVDQVISSWKMRENVEPWAKSMRGPVPAKIRNWSVAREAAIFSRLWLGPEHKAALARWPKKRD